MSDDFLGDRRKALEDAFFARRNQELLERLRRTVAADGRRAAFASATGISDPEVLDRLEHSEFEPESVAAITMAPLVIIAWADGAVQRAERDAVLKAAHERGIDENTAAYNLLLHWLDDAPPADLLETWKHYAVAIYKTLTPAGKVLFHEELIGRTKQIARAAGSFLGITNPVSRAEQRLIEEMDAALSD